ncbi:GmrSD restriction endonuclease domain-containing protein [Gordonia caeni]|uniref:DUF1524 domain-containing protein n=1 Tax=Gordonia caeni TaxID=1007097 RepID=A0ABP7PPJ4_9ACTN
MAAAVAVAMAVTACEPLDSASASEPEPAASTTTQPAVAPDTDHTTGSRPPTTRRDSAGGSLDQRSSAALQALAGLAVKGRAPKTGYSRDMFGQRWSDDVTVEFGHNGCDTRNDILRRDLTVTAVKAGTRDCVVLSGTLDDPYTGKKIDFVRGSATSSAVQIDHVVALSDAWQKGAQQLSSDERRNFANDPRNLLAVDGPSNQKKGDGDAATWLPPNRSYRCTYVARQIEVKAAYRLWVTQAEQNAMTRLLTDCGGTQPTETERAAETATETTTPRTTPRTTTPRTTTHRPQPLVETPAPGGDVYYRNCSAARAAGAAPLYRGQPGYSSKLDRDGDGIACE